MRKGLGVLFLFSLVAIFSIALISASFFDNFLGKITGNPIANSEKGDINQDSVIDKIDLDILVDVAFRGGSFPEGSCLECADINEDGVTDILDVTMMTNYVYRGGTFSTNSLIYICGDTNGDSVLDQTDLDAITSYAFGGVEIPSGAKVDLNGDGVVDIRDVNIMTDHVKRNGPAPTCTSLPSENQTTTTCTNECNSGWKRCLDNTTQTCGNYDSDSCLEWSGSTFCQYGCGLDGCASVPGNQTNTTSCTDSDDGRNYYVKGQLMMSGKVYKDSIDYCQNNNYLLEYDCGWQNGVVGSAHPEEGGSSYICPNGCLNGACVQGNTTNQPPIINYLIGSSDLVVGQNGVWNFQATDPENENLYYGFEFGDGWTANSNENSGVHRYSLRAYSSPGTYSVDFKVREASRTDIRVSLSKLVKVVSPQAGNQPPKIASPLTGQNVVAIGTSNSWKIMANDPNNDALDYWFYWGDGDSSHVLVSSGVSAVASHVYNKLGDYSVYASVSDSKSGGDVAHVPVKVSSSVSNPTPQTSCSVDDGSFYDLGINPLIKKTIKGELNGKYGTYEDYCSSDGKLVEYVCNRDSLKISEMFPDCPNLACKDGALIPKYNLFKISSVEGKKASYCAGNKIKLKLKTIDYDGKFADFNRGFNVQFYTYNVNNLNTWEKDYVDKGQYNGYYKDGYWIVEYDVPKTKGDYFTRIVLYCSRENTDCWKKWEIDTPQCGSPQPAEIFRFSVDNVNENCVTSADIPTGLCGDADLNSEINAIDITTLSDYAFGGVEIPLGANVDLNGDGVVDILDVTILTNYVKRGGPKPTCEKESIKVFSGTSWLHNSYNDSMTCQELCGKSGSDVVVNGCYDRNLEKCTVAQGTICMSGESDYEVGKDYATACCCKGNNFNGCTSTDGVNPFIKGKTTSKEGVVYEDKCDGTKVIDYFCDAWGQVTNINEVVCLDGCNDGACKKVEVTPNPETGPIELPDSIYDEEGVSYDCSGCVEDKKCYPFGYRKNGYYCSDENYLFIRQKTGSTEDCVPGAENECQGELSCDNNFECKSNVCANEQCITQGFLKKILDWFGRLFGS